jgi:hypothetical protein
MGCTASPHHRTQQSGAALQCPVWKRDSVTLSVPGDMYSTQALLVSNVSTSRDEPHDSYAIFSKGVTVTEPSPSGPACCLQQVQTASYTWTFTHLPGHLLFPVPPPPGHWAGGRGQGWLPCFCFWSPQGTAGRGDPHPENSHPQWLDLSFYCRIFSSWTLNLGVSMKDEFYKAHSTHKSVHTAPSQSPAPRQGLQWPHDGTRELQRQKTKRGAGPGCCCSSSSTSNGPSRCRANQLRCSGDISLFPTLNVCPFAECPEPSAVSLLTLV